MRNKSTGRDCDPKPFVPRKDTSFQIGPNSHPRKVTRWLKRREAAIEEAAREDILTKTAKKVVKRHINPVRNVKENR